MMTAKKWRQSIYRFLIIAVFIILTAASSVAQEGIPYITGYDTGDDYILRHWSLCQGSNNEMLFANRTGITTYDGQSWNNYRLNIVPVVIRRDPVSGVVFAGSVNDYGIIKYTPRGVPLFESLCGDTLPAGITDGILFTPESVIFRGAKSISVHDRNNLSSYRRWYAPDDKSFTGFLEADGDYFINIRGQGLHRIDSDTLFPIVTGYMTADCEILFSIDHGDGMVLTGRSDNTLHLFDGIKYYPWEPDSLEYLQNNSLTDGFAVNPGIYAFTTLYGGVLLVDPADGSTIHTINYGNGLTDDEIFAAGIDNNQGLWISHGMGVCRIDLALPLRDYSSYPGLEGTVTSTLVHNDRLWVSTNEGLFYLEEVRNYKGIEVTRKREPAPSRSQIHMPVRSDTATLVVSKEGERDTISSGEKSGLGAFLNRLLGRERDKTAQVTEVEEQEPDTTKKAETVMPDSPAEREPIWIRETISVLNSVSYLFRKTEGLDSRCSLIEGTSHGLLAATSSGLWWVNQGRSEIIMDTRFVNDIAPTNDADLFYAATDLGIFPVRFNGRRWKAGENLLGIDEPVYSLLITGGEKIWASGDNIFFSLNPAEEESSDRSEGIYTFESDFPERTIVSEQNDTILLLTGRGVLFFSEDDNMLVQHTGYQHDEGKLVRYMECAPGQIWINSGDGWSRMTGSMNRSNTVQETLLSLFEDVRSLRCSDNGDLWVANGSSHIYRISDREKESVDRSFSLNINSLASNNGSWHNLSELIFEAGDNSIVINMSAPFYLKETSNRYQYRINRLMSDWSAWSISPVVNLYLEPGDYIVRLRAKNILGDISEEKSISFTIKPPFVKTFWFFLLVFAGGINILALLVYLREKKLRYDKRVLEDKVRERTAEIESTKKHIELQRDEIIKQKEEITSSITYASRIQDAILPEEDLCRRLFRDHFVLFKPRDIVSGDFYWIHEEMERITFAVADCTGHGVPGAIMSMLGISLLNEIASNSNGNLMAGDMLGVLREKVIFSLNQTGSGDEATDGMDMSLCILERETGQLQFAGAFNPLWLVRDGRLTEFSADRMPVGYDMKLSLFNTRETTVQEGDALYLLSDGYYDQFGGKNDKRFSSRRLKSVIREISHLPMNRQREVLDERFRRWMGGGEQIDDVLIMGIRI
ncbi:MAG: SpoIIE family protein phosphatase [Bacteroidales bacterium]|nr:SpoIIE family protein phosphatase [Bacteroidales bacterium]